jgi:hypothetical protein
MFVDVSWPPVGRFCDGSGPAKTRNGKMKSPLVKRREPPWWVLVSVEGLPWIDVTR